MMFDPTLLRCYFVAGTQDVGHSPAALRAKVMVALKAGITAFQFREKGSSQLDAAARVALGQQLQQLCHQFGVPIFVDDDVDLAKQIQADGVPVITAANSGSGILGILSAAGLLYVTYEGFGVVTNAAGSMKNPRKQLPIALFLSLGIVMIIYIIASIVVVMTLGVPGAVANQGHVLAAAGKLVFGKLGMILISVAALVATASAVNSTMFGDENLAIRIAKIDEIPPKFGAMTKIGGTWGLFFTSLIVCVFVVVFPLSSVGQMASLAFLLVYAMVNVGHLRLAKQTGAKQWILVCSVILNLALFALLFS